MVILLCVLSSRPALSAIVSLEVKEDQAGHREHLWEISYGDHVQVTGCLAMNLLCVLSSRPALSAMVSLEVKEDQAGHREQ